MDESGVTSLPDDDLEYIAACQKKLQMHTSDKTSTTNVLQGSDDHKERPKEQGHTMYDEHRDAIQMFDMKSELYLHTRRFSKSLSHYKDFITKNLKRQTQFTFKFVSMALDTHMLSTCTCGPSLGLLMAVADVFGRTAGTPKWDEDAIYWQSLFDRRCTLSSNPVVKTILKIYELKYDFREPLDNDTFSTNMLCFGKRPRADCIDPFANMRDLLGQLGCIELENKSTNTAISSDLQKMFARFLVKLWEAKYGSTDRHERRHRLGKLICNLADQHVIGFENLDLWARDILVPEQLKLHYPAAAKSKTKEDVENEYESGLDDPDKLDVPALTQVKKGDINVEVLQAELQHLEGGAASQLSLNHGYKKQLMKGEFRMLEINQAIQCTRKELAEKNFEKKCLECLREMGDVFGEESTYITLTCIREMTLPGAWENGQAAGALRNFILFTRGEDAAGCFTVDITPEDAFKFRGKLAPDAATAIQDLRAQGSSEIKDGENSNIRNSSMGAQADTIQYDDNDGIMMNTCIHVEHP